MRFILNHSLLGLAVIISSCSREEQTIEPYESGFSILTISVVEEFKSVNGEFLQIPVGFDQMIIGKPGQENFHVTWESGEDDLTKITQLSSGEYYILIQTNERMLWSDTVIALNPSSRLNLRKFFKYDLRDYEYDEW